MRTLNELSSAIPSVAIRDQFDEATRAYSAGAYRSATLTLWIAVVHDLFDKIRRLADDHDAAAVKLVTDARKAQDTQNIGLLQSMERDLLNTASGFELISDREVNQLKRLQDDRNHCAHPSSLGDLDEVHEMTEEQVRAYMVIAVDSVLSQPIVVGRVARERFEADTRSTSWPEEGLTEFVRQRYFTNSRAATKRAIITIAIKSVVKPGNDENVVAGRCLGVLRSIAIIDEEALSKTCGEVLANMAHGITDEGIIRATGGVSWIPGAWEALGADNVARARALLQRATVEDLIEGRAFASGLPQIAELQEPYQLALERLTDAQILDLTRRVYHDKSQFASLIVKRMASARNFRQGEGLVLAASQVAEAFTLEDAEAFADAFVSNSQIYFADGTAKPVINIVETTRGDAGMAEIWGRMYSRFHAEVVTHNVGAFGRHRYDEIATLVGVPLFRLVPPQTEGDAA